MFAEDMSVFYDDVGGFAQAAIHTNRDAVHTPCKVLVEHDLSRYGDVAKVSAATVIVSVQVADIALPPRRGDTFAITGGPVYTVDSAQSSDGMEHRVFCA